MNESDSNQERRWAEEIGPFLDKLASYLGQRESTNHSVSVPLGENRLLLTPVEQLLVRDRASGSTGPDEPHLQLVLDSIGIQVMVLSSVRQLGKAQVAEEAGGVLENTRHAVDLGYQLQYAMTTTMRNLKQDGKDDECSCLSEARQRLSTALSLAEKAMPTDGDGEDVSASESVGPGPRAGAGPQQRRNPQRPERPKTGGVAVPKKPARDKAEAAQARRRIVAVAVSVLAVLAVAYSYFTVFYQPDLAPLTAERFDMEAVERVIPRSPELLVIVDASLWRAMSPEQKEDCVHRVVDVARSEGYRLVEFRTASTAGLAFWHKGGEIRVLK